MGAGIAGLGLAARLATEGRPFLVLERADRVEGTWRDNNYPGCGCDVPSHSFDPSPPVWSRVYPSRDEVDANLVAFVDRTGIRPAHSSPHHGDLGRLGRRPLGRHHR